MFKKPFEKYFINQYNMKKIEELVKIFIDLVSTAQMILANKDYYIRITPSYEMRTNSYNPNMNCTSKVESFLINDYNTQEKQQSIIDRCVFAYNQLSNTEREFFKRFYYDGESRENIQKDMLLYNNSYDNIRKSCTLKFALILGLNNFINLI